MIPPSERGVTHEPTLGLENERPSSLAWSVGSRIYREDRAENARFAEFVGGQPQLDNPFASGLIIAGFARLVDKRLQDPSYIPTFEDVHAISSLREVGKKDASITTAIRTGINDEFDRSIKPLIMKPELLDLINAARKVAETEELPVESVFLNDVLYTQAVAKSNTPKKYAEDSLTILQTVTYERMLFAVKKGIVNAWTGEEEQVIPETEDNKDVDRLADAIGVSFMFAIYPELSDLLPEIESNLRKLHEHFSDFAKKEIKDQIIRFWGTQGIEGLSEETKLALGIA